MDSLSTYAIRNYEENRNIYIPILEMSREIKKMFKENGNRCLVCDEQLSVRQRARLSKQRPDEILSIVYSFNINPKWMIQAKVLDCPKHHYSNLMNYIDMSKMFITCTNMIEYFRRFKIVYGHMQLIKEMERRKNLPDTTRVEHMVYADHLVGAKALLQEITAEYNDLISKIWIHKKTPEERYNNLDKYNAILSKFKEEYKINDGNDFKYEPRGVAYTPSTCTYSRAQIIPFSQKEMEEIPLDKLFIQTKNPMSHTFDNPYCTKFGGIFDMHHDWVRNEVPPLYVIIIPSTNKKAFDAAKRSIDINIKFIQILIKYLDKHESKCLYCLGDKSTVHSMKELDSDLLSVLSQFTADISVRRERDCIHSHRSLIQIVANILNVEKNKTDSVVSYSFMHMLRMINMFVNVEALNG